MTKIAELPKVVVMMDFETLSLLPDAPVTQGAMLGLDLATDEIFSRYQHNIFYPVPPQLNLVGRHERRIDFGTMLFWMHPDNAALGYEILSRCASEDVQELIAGLRHLAATFNQITDDGNLAYELYAQGPQSDLIWVEGLMRTCGIEIPWRYDRIRDLRTLAALAQIDYDAIPKHASYRKHDAYHDALHQLAIYQASILKLRARVE